METSPHTVTILGSGTSTGVPVIGCNCAVCTSQNIKNKRLRSSVLLQDFKNRNVIIDTTPDLRQQVLTANVGELEAVLYTHTHADHCHGFDDLRAFCFRGREAVDCYISPKHGEELKARFDYAFHETAYYGAKPQVRLHEFTEQPFKVLDWLVEPLLLDHGGTASYAFRIGRFAYATDFKRFSPRDLKKWRNKVDIMIASGIRYRQHPSHSTVPETIELFQNLGVKRGIITHLSHEIEHIRDGQGLPENIELAYDGMVIDVKNLLR